MLSYSIKSFNWLEQQFYNAPDVEEMLRIRDLIYQMAKSLLSHLKENSAIYPADSIVELGIDKSLKDVDRRVRELLTDLASPENAQRQRRVDIAIAKRSASKRRVQRQKKVKSERHRKYMAGVRRGEAAVRERASRHAWEAERRSRFEELMGKFILRQSAPADFF